MDEESVLLCVQMEPKYLNLAVQLRFSLHSPKTSVENLIRTDFVQEKFHMSPHKLKFTYPSPTTKKF